MKAQRESIVTAISPHIPQLSSEPIASLNRNVALVTVPWFKDFISWVKDPEAPEPPAIDNTELAEKLKQHEQLKLSEDFEFVETKVFDVLKTIFQVNLMIIRPFVVNPDTREMVILLYPIKFSITFNLHKKQSTADPSWKLNVIKTQFCRKLLLDPTKFGLYNSNSREMLPELSTAGEIAELYGTELLLKNNASASIPSLVHNTSINTKSTGAVSTTDMKCYEFTQSSYFCSFLNCLSQIQQFKTIARQFYLDNPSISEYNSLLAIFIHFLVTPNASVKHVYASFLTRSNYSHATSSWVNGEMTKSFFEKLDAELKEQNSTIISDLFFGEKITHTECSCDYKSDSTEITSAYVLPISHKFFRTTTIKHCFKKLLSPKKSTLTCPHCGRTIIPTHQVTKLPQILVIVLERFNKMSHGIVKDTTKITFPDSLDLQYLTHNEVDSNYKLISVMSHLGGAPSDHYRGVVLDDSTGKWCEVRKSKLLPKEIESLVHTNNANALIYIRDTK